MAPRLSVVIPSFNRRTRLLRLLGTLARQSLAPEQFEVIVVLDGSTDGSAETLADRSWPFHLEVIEQSNAGPAASRNAGAERSRGAIILFVDDDIQLDPRALDEHVRSAEAHRGAIVVGRVECQWPNRGMGRRGESYWRHFDELADGAPLTFRDCYGANVSMEISTFRTVGGFFAPMRRLEDLEFGFRAERAGVPIVFAPAAVAVHDAMKTPPGALYDAFHSGRASVSAWRNRPEFLCALGQGFRRPQGSWRSKVIAGAIAIPFPDRLAWWLGGLPAAKGIRTLHTLLWSRWYLRGARSATASANEFGEYLARPNS